MPDWAQTLILAACALYMVTLGSSYLAMVLLGTSYEALPTFVRQGRWGIGGPPGSESHAEAPDRITAVADPYRAVRRGPTFAGLLAYADRGAALCMVAACLFFVAIVVIEAWSDAGSRLVAVGYLGLQTGWVWYLGRLPRHKGR